MAIEQNHAPDEEQQMQEAMRQDQAPLTYAEISEALFDLLDDCDTACDIAKDNDAMFRSLVHQAHRKRFNYATTDGYSVKFNARVQPIKDAMMALKSAMSDENYRLGWQANLAVMMTDEGVPHERANSRADSFLKMAFDA